MRKIMTASSMLRVGAAALITAMLLGFAVSTTSADEQGGLTVNMRDKCDPTTFNAVFPGVCEGNGNVTFAEFVAKLNPTDFGHNAWRFNPGGAHAKAGKTIKVLNRGGETHSFSEVVAFGAGFVPELNGPLGLGPVPAVVVGPPNFVDAGDSVDIGGLTAGEHLFQCMIHPWMRSTITVK